jgi:uncharacterized membrane protein YqhA
MRWTLAFLAFGLIYSISVYLYGTEYDFIGQALHSIMGASNVMD